MSASILDPLRNVIIYNRQRIRIDNGLFRVHYVSTCIVLMSCSMLIATKMYLGAPINCIANKDLKDVVNEYCYIHSTFTRGRFDKGSWAYEPAKENEIYPGVRPAMTSDPVTVHSYYQWVWILLPLQAITFYLPHWIWEKLEKGIMTMLVGHLNMLTFSDESKVKQRRKIILYLARNRGFHLHYALSYAMSEGFNLVNIIAQIILTDYFLDHAFATYGLKIFQLSMKPPYHRDDMLARVFPTVTACRMATGGPSFGKNQHDILCILSINIIHEKVYIVLWFWFLFVLICSIYSILYRIATLHPNVRVHMLRGKLRLSERRERVSYISTHQEYGVWFLIYRLSQNMDPVSFGELIDDIDKAFQKWDIADLPPKEYSADVPPNSPEKDNTYFAFPLKDEDDDKSPRPSLRRTSIVLEDGRLI